MVTPRRSGRVKGISPYVFSLIGVYVCVGTCIWYTLLLIKTFIFVDKLLDKQEDSEVDDSTAQSSAVNSPAPSLRFVYVV